MRSGLAMAKKEPQRVTCRNASKCGRFCGARSCFASEKCCEITQNNRKTERNSITKMDTPVSQSQNGHLLHRGGKMDIRSASGHVQVTLWTGNDNIREFSSAKIVHLQSGPPFAIVRCLRSCPPRGGPIRSVYDEKIKSDRKKRVSLRCLFLNALAHLGILQKSFKT